MAATATAGRQVEAKSFGSERMREALVGYSFIAGPMLVYALLFFYPIIYAIYISRYDWGVLGKIDTRGWGNYRELLHDNRFGIAIKIADGQKRGLYPAIVGVLDALGLLDRVAADALQSWGHPELRNYRGIRTGDVHKVLVLDKC